MAALYIDENFPFPATEELRRLGHDVVTIQESGHAGLALPDEEVLRVATRERRAVVTLTPGTLFVSTTRGRVMPASSCARLTVTSFASRRGSMP